MILSLMLLYYIITSGDEAEGRWVGGTVLLALYLDERCCGQIRRDVWKSVMNSHGMSMNSLPSMPSFEVSMSVMRFLFPCCLFCLLC